MKKNHAYNPIFLFFFNSCKLFMTTAAKKKKKNIVYQKDGSPIYIAYVTNYIYCLSLVLSLKPHINSSFKKKDRCNSNAHSDGQKTWWPRTEAMSITIDVSLSSTTCIQGENNTSDTKTTGGVNRGGHIRWTSWEMLFDDRLSEIITNDSKQFIILNDKFNLYFALCKSEGVELRFSLSLTSLNYGSDMILLDYHM